MLYMAAQLNEIATPISQEAKKTNQLVLWSQVEGSVSNLRTYFFENSTLITLTAKIRNILDYNL